MASQDVYARAPLVTAQREIRILSLAPGIGDSVLRGDLIVESLNDDDLHYTALSYTWSGPISQCSIIIGGMPLYITENLELALRRIRGPNRPKNVWIDAICINQSDNEEKGVQVSMMGDIYANAARTIVWLGKQSADSDIAMDFIHSLRQNNPIQLDIYSHEGKSEEIVSDGDEGDDDWSDGDSDDNGSKKDAGRADDTTDDDDSNPDGVVTEDDGDGASSDDSLSNDEDSHPDDTRQGTSDSEQIAFQAVKDLMQRQWWTRVWVIQEALKSRRVTVVCGAKEVDIAYFAQLVKARELRGGSRMEPRIPSKQPFVEVLSNWNIYKTQIETGGSPLLDLILLTHRFQASVQKDKIYALLGLATLDARSWIVPDYSNAMSHHMILIRLTAYFLQFSSRPLRFASHCRATNCPSWVSDWTAIDSRIIKLIDREDADFEDKMEYKPAPKPSQRSAGSLERLPHSDHTTAEFNPRFDPPVQNLTRYQMPATLLVHGILVDRVTIAFQIPHVRSVSGNGHETEMSSFKAKIREWETRMTGYLETYIPKRNGVQWKPQWVKFIISDHKRRKFVRKSHLKACLITYLAHREKVKFDRPQKPFKACDPLNFYGRMMKIRGRDDLDALTAMIYEKQEVAATIDIYEAWIQQKNDCESCNDHPKEHPDADASTSRSIPHRLRLANELGQKLGQKIVEVNAGKTMFLTDGGHHYSVTFAVTEGDIICRLWHSFYYLVLRRAGKEHWTLVGHIPDCALLESAKKVDREYARAKTEVFKLI